MFRIQTLNKIAKIGLKEFDKYSEFEIGDNFDSPDGILVRSASMLDMPFAENLLGIARAGIGVNNIPIDKCSELGIAVFNTPGANANAVKELVLMGLFISSRRVSDSIAWINSCKGEKNIPKIVEAGKSDFAGPEIKGKTMGVIGLGSIGGMVANATHHLGMEVFGFDPYLSVEAAWSVSRYVHKALSYQEIYAKSDYITIHTPLTDETKGMFNKDAFSKMKDGVRILNFARGELINDKDMAEALESGKIACYVTDFPNEETLNMKNTINIPHLGASTPESEDNCAVMAAKQLREFFLTGNTLHCVNYPDLSLAPGGDIRYCIFHKNIPNMLGQISATIASEGINIENMLNKSKKDCAYTVFDINGNPDPAVAKRLCDIQGVIKVRIIPA